jgi:hypothetical protein
MNLSGSASVSVVGRQIATELRVIEQRLENPELLQIERAALVQRLKAVLQAEYCWNKGRLPLAVAVLAQLEK